MLGDDVPEAQAAQGFQLMGLYKSLTGNGPDDGGPGYHQQYKSAGIGYKTTSDLLLYSRYDAARTAAMNLPPDLEGGAFRDTIGKYTYVLWVKTTKDMDEGATGSYTFPAALNISPDMERREWDWSSSNTTTTIQSNNIPLNGTPVFLSEHFDILAIGDKPTTPKPVEKDFSAVTVYPNPASSNASIGFTLKGSAKVTVDIYNTEGKLVTKAMAGRSFSSGSYTVPLPVKQLVSGVYYCRFSTEKSEEMKKLVIVR